MGAFELKDFTIDELMVTCMAREVEDIDLEITYSGKTFSAFLKFLEDKKDALKDRTILFWNTYSSIDVSEIIKGVDYRNLPKKLHWIFEK